MVLLAGLKLPNTGFVRRRLLWSCLWGLIVRRFGFSGYRLLLRSLWRFSYFGLLLLFRLWVRRRLGISTYHLYSRLRLFLFYPFSGAVLSRRRLSKTTNRAQAIEVSLRLGSLAVLLNITYGDGRRQTRAQLRRKSSRMSRVQVRQ